MKDPLTKQQRCYYCQKSGCNARNQYGAVHSDCIPMGAEGSTAKTWKCSCGHINDALGLCQSGCGRSRTLSEPRAVTSNEMTQLIDTLRARNDKLCSDAADEIEQMGKAGDELAHQSVYTPFHERWWQARGGHNSCTVCNPSAVETSPEHIGPVMWLRKLGWEYNIERDSIVKLPEETTESPALGDTCPQHGWYRLNAAGCPVCYHEKQQAHSSGKTSTHVCTSDPLNLSICMHCRKPMPPEKASMEPHIDYRVSGCICLGCELAQNGKGDPS